uniref:Uncharacterized protein n=1 Tax=Anguilla anguilla TaxID=7936 RepID=A0A0E9PYT6_ANGAN
MKMQSSLYKYALNTKEFFFFLLKIYCTPGNNQI